MTKTKLDGKVMTITVGENIITENLDDFEKKVKNIKADEADYVIFDFKNVDYICSSGLGLLAGVLRLAYEHSFTIYFCSLSPQIKKLFDVTKFLTMVSQAIDVSSALKQIG